MDVSVCTLDEVDILSQEMEPSLLILNTIDYKLSCNKLEYITWIMYVTWFFFCLVVVIFVFTRMCQG